MQRLADVIAAPLLPAMMEKRVSMASPTTSSRQTARAPLRSIVPRFYDTEGKAGMVIHPDEGDGFSGRLGMENGTDLYV
jgi:hypothetical protein